MTAATGPGVVTSYGAHGMVCSVDHLASAAGIAALREGGSAVDAAVAASAVLAVTCPHLCGMGGDLWALVHVPGEPVPFTVDAAGRAGSGADPVRLLGEGNTVMPFHGDVRSAPVPGCVDGWLALHDRFGVLPLARVLDAAVTHAVTGFPASPLLAAASHLLLGVAGTDELVGAGPIAPHATVRRPGVAQALQAVIEQGRRGFYEGAFGDGLLRLGAGEYVPADLRDPIARWVTPVSAEVWGHQVWTAPPSSQGYLTLLGALVAEGLPVPGDPADPAWPHLLVEAARAAGHDRPQVLHEDADVTPLLGTDEVQRRRALVDPARRNPALASRIAAGGTMHLCAADELGMAVSLIQSNASGFGTLVFEPTTGIGLHNRGIGFSLDVDHPSCYRPGRRPPHTLSPALVTWPDGSLRAVLGTMGGDSQPQILLQLLARFLAHGESPGAAISAPRWVLAGRTGFDTWADPDGAAVKVEHDAPDRWAPGLSERGHHVVVAHPRDGHSFGHAHLLAATDAGWAGASDPRAEVGAASSY